MRLSTLCGVNDMSLSKWHKLNPIIFCASAQLLAVTEAGLLPMVMSLS